MAKVNATEFAEKWQRRTSAAVPDYQAGVQRTTTAPGEAAAVKANKMLANVTAAVQSGKWASRTRSVTLEAWKASALNKGAGRIATGVQAATDDVRDFAEKLLSYETALQAKIKAMPDTTLEDSVNRVAEWVRGMSKFQR